MSSESQNDKTFLEELNRQTKGDLQSQVSMYEVGASIGLAKGEAGSLAEELMVSGLVELRTLSGGISITREGLASLGISLPISPAVAPDQSFSNGPAANKADLAILRHLVDTMKTSLSGLKMEYNQLEEIIVDLKTVEVQLLSPAPKVAVFRELLRSLHASFEIIDNKTITSQLAPHLR